MSFRMAFIKSDNTGYLALQIEERSSFFKISLQLVLSWQQS